MRERRPEDFRVLGEILERVRLLDGYPVYLPNNDSDAFLKVSSDAPAWVAEMAGRVVGHVGLSFHPRPSVERILRDAQTPSPFAHVTRLFVDPPARHQGVASSLLDHALEEAHRLGATATLDVVTRDLAAIALYESRGWRRVGEVQLDIPDFPRFAEYVYVEPGPSSSFRGG